MKNQTQLAEEAAKHIEFVFNNQYNRADGNYDYQKRIEVATIAILAAIEKAHKEGYSEGWHQSCLMDLNASPERRAAQADGRPVGKQIGLCVHCGHERFERLTPTQSVLAGGSDEAHRLFEPEDEPNIISKSTPTRAAQTE